MTLASLAWIGVTDLLSVFVCLCNMVMMLKRAIFNLFGNCRQYLISGKNRVAVPIDVVMEITSYLPVQDVLRCKSVCKPWRDMLSSPRFVNLHTSRAQLLPILSLRPDDDCKQLCLAAELARSDLMDSVYVGLFTKAGFDITLFFQVPALRKQFCLPRPPDLDCCYNLMASCNGLFVMQEEDDSYYVKNPALCKRIRLPHLPQSPLKGRERMQLYHVPSSNQYKLVACCENMVSGIMCLWILTIGEDRHWRYLPNCWAHECSLSKDAPHLFRSFEGQYYNYFRLSYLFDTNDKLLTFDVESEQLIEHEMPVEMRQHETGETVKEFSEGWKGCTAIIFYNEDIVRVFILEDYKCNKWVSNSLIHGGLIDSFREVKRAKPDYSYHILTDDEDRLWFQPDFNMIFFCHLETQKKVYYDSRNYGYVKWVCPSKFTFETCKSMKF